MQRGGNKREKEGDGKEEEDKSMRVELGLSARGEFVWRRGDRFWFSDRPEIEKE